MAKVVKLRCARPPLGGTVGQRDRLRRHRPQLVAVTVGAPAVRPGHDRLGELVDVVDAARRVHPARVRVEALVDEELPPGGRAVGVEPFAARHVLLGAEEEAGVRVDQQQRMAVRVWLGAIAMPFEPLGLAEQQPALLIGHRHVALP